MLGKLVPLAHTFKIRSVTLCQLSWSSENTGDRYQVNGCHGQPEKPCWNEELSFTLLTQSVFLLCIDPNFWFGLLWAPLDALKSPTHITGVHSTSKKSLGGAPQGAFLGHGNPSFGWGAGELVHPSECLRGKQERTQGSTVPTGSNGHPQGTGLHPSDPKEQQDWVSMCVHGVGALWHPASGATGVRTA